MERKSSVYDTITEVCVYIRAITVTTLSSQSQSMKHFNQTINTGDKLSSS